MARHYFDGKTVTLTRTELTLCTLTENGETYTEIEPRFLFPLTRSDYITFLDRDGHEIGILKDIDTLPAESAKALRAILSEYYRIPKILEVLEVNEKNGSDTWTVRTERGITSFQIHNRNASITPLPNGQVWVRDTNDNRYEIPNLDALDAQSKRRLNSQL